MRGVVPGVLLLAVLAGWFPPASLAARSHERPKTIRDLSGPLPLELFQRSVPAKFYQSLLVSPLEDWSIVRAQVIGTRFSGARIIRSAANPAYDALALKFANELPLVANERSRRTGQRDSALMHLWIYKIADGVMAVSFSYPEAFAGPQTRNVGTVRLSVATVEGRWTEITSREMREDKRWSLRQRDGRRLHRMDRMPMDATSAPLR